MRLPAFRRPWRAALAAAGLTAALLVPSASQAEGAHTRLGEVQGSIAQDETDFRSPLLNQKVTVQGVVTQRTLDGNGANGFFLQERADATDGDPDSSDGIFVYNGEYTDLRTAYDSPAEEEYGSRWDVSVGDEIVLKATVKSYYGNTQFTGSSAFVWDVVDHHGDPRAVVASQEAAPPDDAEDARRYFHRRLGMQLTVAADSAIVSNRATYGADSEMWAVHPDHEIAQRGDYSARAFRDAHPLDNDPSSPDGNGYRFLIGAMGVKSAAGDSDELLPQAKTYDRVTEDTAGGVYLTYGKYALNPESLSLEDGLSPDANNPVSAPSRSEAAVAAYNVENLYDLRDNPESGCDFEGNPGCDDGVGTIDPPFNYVPSSQEEYEDRLARTADQIVNDLHEPAVLLVQETEDQDVCSVEGGGLVCDLENTGESNAHKDGAPDSLQELALAIGAAGGAEYRAVYDSDAGDLRGITTAFLYRTDRAELLEARDGDPLLGSSPAIDYDGAALESNSDVQNPKALNAELPERVTDECTKSGPKECDGVNVYPRAPQVGHFRVWSGEPGLSSSDEVYLVNNHFSSGPDRRVLQRIEQADYLARVSEAGSADGALLLAGGDFNVFPRPDDPYAEGERISGDWYGPSDQLKALYDSSMESLYAVSLEEEPVSAYTYGYQGQTQTLDQFWANPAAMERLADVGVAHINSDYTAVNYGLGEEPEIWNRGVSDHDPEVVALGMVSFDSVRGLVGDLRTRGELSGEQAAWLDKKIGQIERHPHKVRQVTAKLDQWSRSGSLDGDVAAALRAEVALLAG
ncbi:hypothetical protein [Salininema proteolyticum]|uniref:Endonuclease/exonuclease/phosphatase domain-containing protein n=1 Tax=Salininema proteolyticum TaxID=1607685 RepID=A0ABV8TZC7_9ACTN